MSYDNEHGWFNAVAAVILVALVLSGAAAWHFFAPCAFFTLSEAPIRCVR